MPVLLSSPVNSTLNVNDWRQVLSVMAAFSSTCTSPIGCELRTDPSGLMPPGCNVVRLDSETGTDLWPNHAPRQAGRGTASCGAGHSRGSYGCACWAGDPPVWVVPRCGGAASAPARVRLHRRPVLDSPSRPDQRPPGSLRPDMVPPRVVDVRHSTPGRRPRLGDPRFLEAVCRMR